MLVVVTRYFGGILLGTGGLVRSYSEATNKAILENNLLEMEMGYEMEITLDYSSMLKLCFRVAKIMPDIPEDPRKAYPITNKLGKIEEQGDGFRSLVGIILGLLFSKGRIVLLDEPEAFLHPAQARF